MGLGLFSGNKEKKEILDQEKRYNDASITNSIMMKDNIDEQFVIEKKEKLIELTQWQQNREPSMQKIFSKFSGYYYDKDKRILTKSQIEEPIMTLNAAVKIIGYVETLDHNVMLGSWDEKRINTTMRYIASGLWDYVKLNHKELGIDITQASYVLWTICNTIEPNYMRGLNNGERRRDQEIKG